MRFPLHFTIDVLVGVARPEVLRRARSHSRYSRPSKYLRACHPNNLCRDWCGFNWFACRLSCFSRQMPRQRHAAGNEQDREEVKPHAVKMPAAELLAGLV